MSQDFSNTNAGNGKSGNQNYKYVPWQNIANAFAPTLPMDNTFDPRTIGAPGGPTPTPGTNSGTTDAEPDRFANAVTTLREHADRRALG